MSLDLKPGAKIAVTITKDPTNAAAAKTLSRLFAKDAANRRLGRKRQKMLQAAVTYIRRGGRPWANRPKAPALVKPARGTTCRLTTTTDMIHDLASVRRFVEIKPA